jgi:quercetin dioxygenase-like cupin family protein
MSSSLWRSSSTLGSRTRPHRHPSDQVLSFVGGSGFVVFPSEEEQRVPEGGLVVVPARLVHMHGATDEEPICHLAIRCSGRTDWHPPVPDEGRHLVAQKPASGCGPSGSLI